MNINNIDYSNLSVDELFLWVKKKAHQLYLARERGQGSDWEDWFEAEMMLVKEILNKNL